MTIRMPNLRLTLQRILFLVLVIVFSHEACLAQKTANDSLVAILMPDDPLPAEVVKLKSAVLGGEDYTRECAYFELLSKAKMMAIELGANVLKLDARKNHSKTQACDEIDVSLYSTALPRKAEQSFSWNKNRPLTWDDFKGPVRAEAGRNAAAETSCGIAIETNLVTKEGQAKVFVFNTFDKRTSWVKKEKQLPEILEHEQGHWNICEIYTRKIQARFDAIKISGAKLNSTVTEIYDELSHEYIARQEKYEQETQHGTFIDAQKRWTELIDAELDVKLTGKL